MHVWFALALAFSLQGCYTRLYLGDNEARAEADSLAFLMDSAAAVDSLYSTDRIIINRYYDQRRYRGYPYEEWDDPFFEFRMHPRLRGYWEYYYDPYWEYRRPYRRALPYRPYRPYYPPSVPPGTNPPDTTGGRKGSSGRNLYPPPPRIPPPERGKRREGSEGSEPQPSTQEPESPPPRASGDTAAGDGQGNPPPSVPPPDRGKRK